MQHKKNYTQHILSAMVCLFLYNTPSYAMDAGVFSNYSQTPTDQLQLLASNGDQRALFHLANRKLKGMGQPVDTTGAFQIFKTLADQGFLEAKLNVGRLYLQGKGTSQDIQASKKYLSPCAETGDSRALFMLAKIAESTEASQAVLYQLYKKVATDSSISGTLREVAQRRLTQLSTIIPQSEKMNAELMLSHWLKNELN